MYTYYKFPGTNTCFRKLFQFGPPIAHYGDACENWNYGSYKINNQSIATPNTKSTNKLSVAANAMLCYAKSYIPSHATILWNASRKSTAPTSQWSQVFFLGNLLHFINFLGVCLYLHHTHKSTITHKFKPLQL